MKRPYIELSLISEDRVNDAGSFWHHLSPDVPTRIANVLIDLPDEGSLVESIEVAGDNQLLGPIPADFFTEVASWRIPDFFMVLPTCAPATLVALTLSGKARRVRVFFEAASRRLC